VAAQSTAIVVAIKQSCEMAVFNVLPDITISSYVPHQLHAGECNWIEKNCYIDLYIEVLNGLKLEPLAMLPFTLAVDFVGDQWTFFKPQLAEMRDLYGVDVQEMSMWRPLIDHCIEHLGSDRLISVEVDAYWLPDTQATDYRKQHTKTTIAIVKLDVVEQRLGYFHNAGYYELAGDDFRNIFRIDVPETAEYLNPYAELIHIDKLIRRPTEELIELSCELLRKYIKLLPDANPIARFAERFEQELPILQDKGLEYYHLWAFNNTRQLGSAFELAASYLKWLTAASHYNFSPAISRFEKISTENKGLILKVARAVNSKRALDLNDYYKSMAEDWEQGMRFLKIALSS
jgi:hypothetical protein